MREFFLVLMLRLALSLGGFLSGLFVIAMAKLFFHDEPPQWVRTTIIACVAGIVLCWLGLVWTTPDMVARFYRILPPPPALEK